MPARNGGRGHGGAPGGTPSDQAIRAATHPQRLRLLRLLAGHERTVSELVRRSGLAPNLVSHHLRELRRRRLVWARQYGRERRYGLDAGALVAATEAFAASLVGDAPAERVARPRILFVCVRNAGRSQMALAFFERAAGGAAIGDCAGSDPAGRIHPLVRTAMREAGARLARRPQRVTATMVADADLVIDMGCGDALPAVPGVRRVTWRIPDPEGQSIEAVRRIRDQIAGRVERLVRSLPRTAPA